MPSRAERLISTWGPALLTVLGWAYFLGVYSEKFAQLERRQAATEARVEAHANALAASARDIAVIAEWVRDQKAKALASKQ